MLTGQSSQQVMHGAANTSGLALLSSSFGFSVHIIFVHEHCELTLHLLAKIVRLCLLKKHLSLIHNL